jgi:hypothetical protein
MDVLSSASNLHDGGTIVGDGLSAILVHHQKVTAVRTKSGFDSGLDGETGIDVGDNLSLALRGIGSCKKKTWSVIRCDHMRRCYIVYAVFIWTYPPLDFDFEG